MTDCPICGNRIDERTLSDVGLDTSCIERIREKVESKSLGIIFDLGEIALKYLHPERLGAEFQVHEALENLSNRSLEVLERQQDLLRKLGEDQRQDRKQILEQHQQELFKVNQEISDTQRKYLDATVQLSTGLQQIRERIGGTAIGGPGEIITIKDLKSAFTGDLFNHAKAASGGADIVAEVRESGETVGKIVVSVKYQEKWKDDFVLQLERNLREEKTEFGVLVSKAFPDDSLNDKAYLTEGGYFVVKPEYAVIAYLGMREAAIHLNKARATIREEEDRMKTRERVAVAIREWLSGENFHRAVEDLDLAIRASNDTATLVQQWQNYADERSDKVQKMLQKLRGYLVACSGLLAELQSKLGEQSLPNSAALASETGI